MGDEFTSRQGLKVFLEESRAAATDLLMRNSNIRLGVG